MSRRIALRSTAAGLALAAVVCLWIAFAPTQLGGRATYALIVGSSMEPGLERGDLAIVRTKDRYRAGDVILFDDRALGRDVLHRIVATSGGRFVTKGDNNGYRDDFRPALGDVRGALWLHLPAVGRPLSWLRAPWHAALLIGLTALLAVGLGSGAGAATQRRRQQQRRPSTRGPAAVPRDVVLAGSLGAVGIFAFLALLAWTRPATHPVAAEAYAQQAHVSYRAPTVRSEVYPDGSADTGEPVFLQLAHRLDVDFAWALESEVPHEAHGTASVEAVLSDARGWERRIPLVAPRPFSGDSLRLTATLDLRRLQRLVDRVSDLTGGGVTTWSLTIHPAVQAEGTVGGSAVGLSFDAPLPFTLDGVRLQPEVGDGTIESLTAPRVGGTLEQPVATTLALGIDVRTMRLISLLALAAALGAAFWARPSLGGKGQPSGHELVAARLGGLLIEAAEAPTPHGRLVELEGLDDLLRLAEARGLLVLHTTTTLGHEYLVDDGGTVYRFRAGGRSEAQPMLRAAGGRP
jgi:signal peptidase